MVVEAVAQGVTRVAEEDLHLVPALVLLSPPSQGPARLVPAPTAALAPTHAPGLQTPVHTYTYRSCCKDYQTTL